MNYEALMKKQLLHMPAYRLPPQISNMMKRISTLRQHRDTPNP